MVKDSLAILVGVASAFCMGGAVFLSSSYVFEGGRELRKHLRTRLPHTSEQNTGSALRHLGLWLASKPLLIQALDLCVIFQSAFDKKNDDALRAALYRSERKAPEALVRFRRESAGLAAVISFASVCLATVFEPPEVMLVGALGAQIGVPVLRARLLFSKNAAYKTACENQLPDMLSLLVLVVRAGSTFDAALARYAGSFDTELAQEVRKLHEAYTSGITTRSKALEDFARSIDSEPVYWFVASVKRSLLSGGSLAKVLETQLHEMRAFKRERIEEEISKKPVKLLIPLGLFILPAMLILLLGPVLMEVISGMQTGY